MTYTKIRINTSGLPEFLPDILIARLAEMGIESFEEGKDELSAYAPVNEINASEISGFLTQMLLDYEMEEIQPQNWNQKWEENFRFIEIDDKVLIRAEFHKVEKDYPYVIRIHPKMAFGTGHHQTTRLVIRHMLEMNLENKSVLDFGTGTGVLAILAEMMGATDVLGIDIDEWAVNNSLENIEINETKNIEVVQGNGDELTNKRYDIILANVNRNALLDRKDVLLLHLENQGELVLSGLLHTDLADIREAYGNSGLKFETVKQEDDWIAVRFTRQS